VGAVTDQPLWEDVAVGLRNAITGGEYQPGDTLPTEAELADDEFRDLLRTFRAEAFYYEAQPTYALDYEETDLRLFLDGRPVPPPEIGWWRPWLDQIAELTRQGKQVARVRVIGEPPSGYQRWQLWSLPWHAAAGEQITYLTRLPLLRQRSVCDTGAGLPVHAGPGQPVP
jgi:hypothetical protein